MFSGLPVCKVRLSIDVTGFDPKTVQLDLAKYKSAPVQVVAFHCN
jgi:hypothetical protein